MICKAMKYLNKTKVTTRCTKEAEYGCLCRIHARQISGTPLGFSFNRVRRVHLPNLTDLELKESVESYRGEKGDDIKLTLADPLKYTQEVLNFIREHESVDSHEVITHVLSVSTTNDMTASKVGTILRVLKARGLVKRTSISLTLDGRKRGSARYELA